MRAVTHTHIFMHPCPLWPHTYIGHISHKSLNALALKCGVRLFKKARISLKLEINVFDEDHDWNITLSFIIVFNISYFLFQLFVIYCHEKWLGPFLRQLESLFIAIPRSSNKTPSMFASSLIVIDVHVRLIVRTFNLEAPRQRETLSSILRRDSIEIAIYFKLSFPYLSRSTSLRPLRAFLFPSSFPPSVFQLGLRLTLPGERMAARLLGSPPAQIAFARAQNLWTAMIKFYGIIIECLSRRSRWKVLQRL